MEFLYINVLFFMLIPILLLIFLIATKKSSMQNLFPQAIYDKLYISNKHMTRSTRNVLLFFVLILFTIALARPVMNKQEQTIQQEVTPIVVAIDVSKSMLANDIYPTRLALAKNKLLRIIKQSQHNALGVLLFAKSAFILSPITQDFSSLTYLVENFDNGLNFDNGSNIHSLLEASNKLFRNYSNKNLLIISDGANKDDFSTEIEYANTHNINVYILATATTKPTPIKIKEQFLTDKDDNIVTVALNENIKELALNTNGGYINYSLDNADITAILKDIENKSKKDQLNNQKVKTYTELFYYPLSLALFLLLIAFSSLPSKKAVAMFTLLLLIDKPLKAQVFDFQTIDKANEAYEQKQYKKAAKEFKKVSQSKEGHYNFANALYKDKKYNQALQEYKKVITSNKELEYKKLHNMGNSYVKLNKLEDAQKMYEKALTLKEDQQTKENLEMVKKALQNKQKQANKNKKNKQNKKDNNEQNKSQKNKEQKNQDQKKNDKKSKNNEEKNKQKSKDNKEQKEKDKKQSNQENNKNNEDRKKSSKEKFEQQKAQQGFKKNEMSDLEEKKWFNQLKNKKTPVLLRKVPTKTKESNSSTPW